MPSCRFDYATFTSAEVEAIAGVKADTQRNWRRHGHTTSIGEGWNRHPAQEVAIYLAMAKLVAWQLPPATAKAIAAIAAQRITLFAYEVPGAAMNERGGPITERPVQLPPNLLSERFLMATTSGISIVANPASFFASVENADVVIVLDLQQLGAELVARAGRPLVVQRWDD